MGSLFRHMGAFLQLFSFMASYGGLFSLYGGPFLFYGGPFLGDCPRPLLRKFLGALMYEYFIETYL